MAPVRTAAEDHIEKGQPQDPGEDHGNGTDAGQEELSAQHRIQGLEKARNRDG